LIDLGLLQNDIDVSVLREGLKPIQRFFNASVWKDYLIAPTRDLENMTTDALNDFIRNTAAASWHLVGSATMSARNADYGVVDPDLLVKGVRGLRIIDASVLVSECNSLV
jgi:choline dehydrogenase-like flavoprotein